MSRGEIGRYRSRWWLTVAAAGAVRIQAVLRGRRSRSLSQELREASAEEQAVSATIIAHAFGRLLRRRRDALAPEH